MLEGLPELSLDPERVRRQRDASFGLGRAYSARATALEVTGDRELSLYAAATNFRRAAANSLLLGETNRAGELFHQAAVTYLAAGAAYGVLIENLGYGQRPGEDSVVEGREDPWLEGPREAADVYALWGTTAGRHGPAWPDAGAVRFRRQLETYRTERVGILGLPVALHLEVFDSLTRSGDHAGEGAVQEAVFPILAAYAAAILRYKSDRYHWTRLAVPFHPVEPDVIAMLVAVNRILSLRRESVGRIITALPIGHDALLLLRGALEQYRAWGNENELVH
jgi:hypothetical protein